MSNSTRSILNKILWEGKSRWLLLGAILGTFIGLFLLLATLQFYLDVQELLKGDSNPSDQYVQINKRLNLFNTLGVKSAFSEEEIEGIQSQPFVLKLGKFTSNDFRAGASSDMLGFYTELFFETVPKDFLDVSETSFRWTEGQALIPIIISKDYLALYNFGFAPSQGLPQVTPSTVSKLNMEITISGQGKQQSFNGKIVGFSERINSILVPSEFMDWANQEFRGEPGPPSRLILQVQNPMAKDFQAFLNENGYEVSTGRLIGSQFGVLLKIVLSVLWGLGLLILALSMLVFVLNFQLMIAQRRPEIQLLLETGHFPKQITGLLSKRFAFQFGIIVVLVFASLMGLRIWQVAFFGEQGFEISSNLDIKVCLAGLGFSILLLLMNMLNIQKAVSKLT